MRCALLLMSMLSMSACTSNWYVGEWQVTDAKFPGISAMGMEEAGEWFGSTAIYSESGVSFRNEQCDAPHFGFESLTQDDFRTSYRATFSDLDITGDRVEILHVGCPSAWIAPGATFIQADRGTGYLLWDGVFFKVERNAP